MVVSLGCFADSEAGSENEDGSTTESSTTGSSASTTGPPGGTVESGSTGSSGDPATTTTTQSGSTTTEGDTTGSTSGSSSSTAEPDTEGDVSTSTGEVGCTPSQTGVCGRSALGVVCVVADNEGSFGEETVAGPYSDVDGWSAAAHNWLTIQFPDVDGDGISDVCGRANGGISCSLGVGDGTFAGGSLWTNHFNNADGWTNETRFGPLTFPDVDGDGNDDVCSRGVNGIRCGLSNGIDGFADSTIWVAAFTDLDGWAGASSHWGSIQFVDVTGDGAADVCGRSTGGVSCAVSNGTNGFDAPAQWSTRYANPGWAGAEQWGTIGFPDVDGDGQADVCGHSNTGIVCELSDGTAFGGALVSDGWDELDGWDLPEQWGTIAYPDVNGDGNADVCGRNATGIQCGLSDGVDITDATQWSTSFSNGSSWNLGPFYWATLQFADINADGYDDVCGRGSMGLVCALSNGADGFETAGVVSDSFPDTAEWENSSSYYRTIQFARSAVGDCPEEPDPSYQFAWRTSALPPR